jgi:hypothetical protein
MKLQKSYTLEAWTGAGEKKKEDENRAKNACLACQWTNHLVLPATPLSSAPRSPRGTKPFSTDSAQPSWIQWVLVYWAVCARFPQLKHVDVAASGAVTQYTRSKVREKKKRKKF